MARSLFLHLMALCLLLTGCGQIFVGFVSNPGNPTSVSGIVITVQIESTNDLSVELLTTAVTLNNNAGVTSTFSFCGDQRSRFPINQQVRVDFTSGVSCSTLNGVVFL
jgi:uncharacterized protein YceK